MPAGQQLLHLLLVPGKRRRLVVVLGGERGDLREHDGCVEAALRTFGEVVDALLRELKRLVGVEGEAGNAGEAIAEWGRQVDEVVLLGVGGAVAEAVDGVALGPKLTEGAGVAGVGGEVDEHDPGDVGEELGEAGDVGDLCEPGASSAFCWMAVR